MKPLFKLSIAKWKSRQHTTFSYPKASWKSWGSAWAHRPWWYLLSSCRNFCLSAGVRGWWDGGVEGGVMGEGGWVLGVSERVKSIMVELGDVGLRGDWDLGLDWGMLIARVLKVRVVFWVSVGCFDKVVLGDCLHGDLTGTGLAFGTGSMRGYTRRSTILLLPGFST